MINRIDMDINTFEEIAFHKVLGLKILGTEPDKARIGLDFKPELAGAGDAYHGGVISSLVDIAGGLAAWSGYTGPTDGMKCSTITLNIQYIAVARGDGLIAEGVVSKRGKEFNYVILKLKPG